MTELLPDAALYGYASRFSVAAGSSITFHVSGEDVDRYQAQLVRLRHGLETPGAPGLREVEIGSDINGEYRAERHDVDAGSFVEVPDGEGLLSGHAQIEFRLGVFPTLVDREFQGLIGQWDVDAAAGYALVMVGSRVNLWVGDGANRCAIASTEDLELHTWYAVSAGLDLSRRVAWVEHVPLGSRADRVFAPANRSTEARVQDTLPAMSLVTDAPFRIGALARRTGPGAWAGAAHFNGKRTVRRWSGDDAAKGQALPRTRVDGPSVPPIPVHASPRCVGATTNASADRRSR